MKDSQKEGRAASGGQRIDDHSFWAGSRSKASVFPDGPHKEKEYVSVEGAGSLMRYEDNDPMIKATQEEGVKKAKARPLKEHYRN